MKSCLALRHVLFEDAGILEPLLTARAFNFRYVDVGIETLDLAEIDHVDLLLVLGGPIGVYEEDAYPFLIAETTG